MRILPACGEMRVELAMAYGVLAGVALAQHDSARAEEYYRKAIHLNPVDHALSLELASLLVANRRSSEAQSILLPLEQRLQERMSADAPILLRAQGSLNALFARWAKADS